jgi:hypothetical protein
MVAILQDPCLNRVSHISHACSKIRPCISLNLPCTTACSLLLLRHCLPGAAAAGALGACALLFGAALIAMIVRMKWQLKMLQQRHDIGGDQSIHASQRLSFRPFKTLPSSNKGGSDPITVAFDSEKDPEASDDMQGANFSMLPMDRPLSNRASMGGSTQTRVIDSTSYTVARGSSATWMPSSTVTHSQDPHTTSMNHHTFDSDPTSNVRPACEDLSSGCVIATCTFE